MLSQRDDAGIMQLVTKQHVHRDVSAPERPNRSVGPRIHNPPKAAYAVCAPPAKRIPNGRIREGSREPSEVLLFDRNRNWESDQSLNTRDVKAWETHPEEFLPDSANTPWFLLASFSDPHKPYHPQVMRLAKDPVRPEEIKPFAVYREIDTPKVREQIAGYYNTVQHVDRGGEC